MLVAKPGWKRMVMVYEDFEAGGSELIAMNLAIAAIDRWLENSSEDRGSQEVGREIGAAV
jgi:hypothetical protein